MAMQCPGVDLQWTFATSATTVSFSREGYATVTSKPLTPKQQRKRKRDEVARKEFNERMERALSLSRMRRWGVKPETLSA